MHPEYYNPMAKIGGLLVYQELNNMQATIYDGGAK
tara:strand:+ start:9 stop:113 length:105 start_codon:yes stop_codon:yes gene_type:complete